MDNIDTFGKWFLEFEKRNECCLGLVGIYDENKTLEPRLYHHARYDAVSALLSYLDELDLIEPARHLPKIPYRSEPGLPRQLFSFFIYLITSFTRLSPRKVRVTVKGWPRQPVKMEQARIAWRIFDEGQSKMISELAEQNKSNINSYLLSKLIYHLDPIWVNKNSKICVGIPISLHKDIKVGLAPVNKFSVVDIWLDESTTAKVINQLINEKLKRNKHYVNWTSYNLPRYIGTWFYDYMMIMIGYYQQRNILFSNLGSWSNESGNAVFLIPPVFHYNPVSVGVLSWGNKISIALQVHPHMDLNAGILEDMMDDWSTDLISKDNIHHWASSRTTGNLNFINK